MDAVHSPRFYRVASLKPRLVSRLRLRRQRLRGETWYLLSDAGSGAGVRLNAAAYAVAGRFDGRRSVQQLWEQSLAAGAAAEPATQDEVIDVLSQLQDAALLQFDGPAGAAAPDLRPGAARAGAASRRSRGGLLAWRLPLADPSALLDRLAPLQRLLFSRAAFVVWALAVALLLLLALQHGPTLVAHGRQWLATPRYALLALLLYAPVKALHELSHGLAVRRWGGTVREAGVTLMLGLPAPYVDASAAAGFSLRRQRIAVGAAGMMAELALAAVALPLWLALPDGLARDAAFVTLFITGLTTLVFNANPLQRFDGYYILADALDLPNLAPRSRAWWTDLLRRRLLRLHDGEPMATARGERPWLVAYAPLAWLYTLAVAVLAAGWLGEISLGLGVACGAVLAWQVGLQPLLRLLTPLRRAALAQQRTARRWRRLALAGSAALALLMVVPLPQRTRLQGVVWPPERTQLRAEEDGFVESVLIENGRPVQAGEAVLQLANPALETQFARQEARVSALETELVQALPGDDRNFGSDKSSLGDGRAGDARAELAAAEAELERLRERLAALTVRAQVAGRVALPKAADLPGRYLHRGGLAGRVLTGAAPTVRVALPEAEASDLRRDADAVGVRLAASPGRLHAARLLHDGVGAVKQLPSAALSERHGGPVATDPADKDDLKPVRPVVLLDVQLADTAADGGEGDQERIGERAWVRFDTGHSPLVVQLARGLRRELLQRFNPQF